VVRSVFTGGALALLFLSLSTATGAGDQEHWAAYEAELVVVGTLHPMRGYPWFDGWHMGGTIEVREVLYGRAAGGTLELRHVLRWPSDLRLLRGYLTYSEFLTREGLWFLNRLDRGSWQPPVGSSGFEPLAARADYEVYIREHRH
jgi:hypothetical protein